MKRLAGTALLPIAAVLMAAAAPPTTPAPVDPAKVTITTTKLAPGVAVLFGAGGRLVEKHFFPDAAAYSAYGSSE